MFLTDILDMLIIAAFSYIAILFLRQTRSLMAFAGIGILGGIYILARAFHLYITALILQSFFSIFIIVLVIVFQDELKRSFELIAASGPRRMKNKTALSFSSTIFSIVQAVSSLTRKKHGALIIIPGNELIERHIRGGNILDGIATSPLLESIFDPKSPGHDGAIVIDKDRISKFGVHLPLSQNIKQIKERGTRHSAAIGISEKTDALAIVISEERGEISIAKQGRMKLLKDTQELEKHLNQHFREKFPEKPQSFFRNIFRERAFEKFSAIAIACIAWFFVVFQAEIVQRDFSVPISFTNISAEEKIIESTVPETVTVTLSSRGQTVLSALSPNSIRIIIPGDKIESGVNEIELERTDVTHPFNVSIVNISPSTIEIVAQEYTTYELPVEINITREPEELRIEETSVSPDKIKILVPKEESPPEKVFTEGIDASDFTQTEIIETRIDIPDIYKIHKNHSRTVQVTIKISEEEVEENKRNNSQ